MRLRKMAAAGVFCALLAVVSQLVIPLPAGIPLTFQVLAVALCGCCLGWKWGTVSVLVYLLLGGVGLPLFSGFGGGIGWLLGPTGGFLWGFLPLVLGCGFRKYPIAFGGLAVCHLMGVAQLSWVNGISMWQAALVGSFPYLWKDVLLVWAAFLIAKRIPRKFF